MKNFKEILQLALKSEYIEEEQFEKGSRIPKIEAAIQFVEVLKNGLSIMSLNMIKFNDIF